MACSHMQLRDFLGARADDPEVAQLLQAQHLPYSVAPVAERGTIAFSPANGEAYTVEEAVVRLGRLRFSALDSSQQTSAAAFEQSRACINLIDSCIM